MPDVLIKSAGLRGLPGVGSGRRVRAPIAMIVLLLAVGGCSGSPTSRCEAVGQKLSGTIAEGLKVQGGGTLRGAQAVKSTAFEKVWMISADIEGPGLSGKDDIGTWATNDLTAGKGLIFSVGAVAREFSQWGPGPGFNLSDDGVAESRACVTVALR